MGLVCPSPGTRGTWRTDRTRRRRSAAA